MSFIINWLQKRSLIKRSKALVKISDFFDGYVSSFVKCEVTKELIVSRIVQRINERNTNFIIRYSEQLTKK
jgi:translation initiation factor 2 beta subunit (eIF-2beta)/eIF-5